MSTHTKLKPILLRALPFIILFGLVFVRFCYYGLQYFPQLDDHIQYNRYFRPESLLAWSRSMSRPLPAFLDTALWTQLRGAMLVAVFAISAMYAAAALLLKSAFSRHFSVSWLFPVLLTLLPVALEATYWLSAATRIVVGLFFAAIALKLFDKWLSGGRWFYIALFLIAQYICFNMYEQVLVFSVTATLLMAFLSVKQTKRAYAGLISVPLAALSYLLTKLLSTSALLESRGDIIMPFDPGYFTRFLPQLLQQLKSAFLGGGFYTLVKGFWRGAGIIVTSPNFIYIFVLLALVASLLVFLLKFAKKTGEDGESSEKRRFAVKLTVGILLAAAPIAPFFILSLTWVSLRAVVPSLPGLALIADAVFELCVSRAKARQTILAITASSLALVFCVSSVSELHDYKLTTEYDDEIVSLLAEAAAKDEHKTGETVGLLNVSPVYLTEQNFYYHEHIHGVTESNWALTGALNDFGNPNKLRLVPLPSGIMYEPWAKSTNKLDNFASFYMLIRNAAGKFEFVPVTAVPDANGKTSFIHRDTQQLLATSWEEDNFGYLELESGVE
jgi:hypothetical protein